jgi:hypothetical protein
MLMRYFYRDKEILRGDVETHNLTDTRLNRNIG